MKNWQLQQAKAHFSELVRQASNKGPQSVTVRGKAAVIVISFRDFQKLKGKRQPSFVEFMQKSPLQGVKLELKRDKSLCRGDEGIDL
jgi:prevent-host-death family protein